MFFVGQNFVCSVVKFTSRLVSSRRERYAGAVRARWKGETFLGETSNRPGASSIIVGLIIGCDCGGNGLDWGCV